MLSVKYSREWISECDITQGEAGEPGPKGEQVRARFTLSADTALQN